VDDLRPSAASVLEFIDDWTDANSLDAKVLDIMGFSQGAALMYALALLFPGRVARLAALSGFLPGGAETLLAARPFAGKSVFVAHGTNDDLIPVEQARDSVKVLEASGAQVVYCETEIGHKVGADCMKGIESFFGTPDHRIGNRQG
jgi:phospholipase/carboxylesterase